MFRIRKCQFSLKCQRMFTLPHSCSHFTWWQSNTQNSPCQTSIVREWELPDIQTGFRKGRGTRDQIANITEKATSKNITEKAREFQKNIYFCFIDSAKAFGCVDCDKVWKIQEMGIPDHLTCLLRNPCAGQEATVRTRYGTMNWFKLGRGVCQSCILSPCLFNL